jgi:hypothetical protein
MQQWRQNVVPGTVTSFRGTAHSSDDHCQSSPEMDYLQQPASYQIGGVGSSPLSDEGHHHLDDE